MGEYVELAYMIHFEIDEETATKRIMKRSTTEQRIEDNEVSLKKRLMHFESEEIPIINKYTDRGKIITIDAL